MVTQIMSFLQQHYWTTKPVNLFICWLFRLCYYLTWWLKGTTVVGKHQSPILPCSIPKSPRRPEGAQVPAWSVLRKWVNRGLFLPAEKHSPEPSQSRLLSELAASLSSSLSLTAQKHFTNARRWHMEDHHNHFLVAKFISRGSVWKYFGFWWLNVDKRRANK